MYKHAQRAQKGLKAKKERKRILLNLIGELNQTLTMNLDPTPDLQPASDTGKVAATFWLWVPATLTGQQTLSSAQGQTVKRATIPGWRCTKQKVGVMAKLVAEKMWGVTGQCTVVFHLYDNCFFMTVTEEGGLIPAVQDEVGGRYHVHGESVMVPKEMQYSTFLLSKPILEVAAVEVKRRSCCVPCRDTSTMAAAMMRSIPPTSRMRTTSLIWIMLSLPATGT